jgi:hypothetical protein
MQSVVSWCICPSHLKRLTIEKTLAYYKICTLSVNYESVTFYGTGPSGQFHKTFVRTMNSAIGILPKGVDPIELFGINLLTLFCKLDVLITLQQIMLQLNGLAFKKLE